MRKKCDKVVDCLDAEDELNCKPLLSPSLTTDHGMKRLLSGRELEEEILSKGESSLLMERGGQVNDIQPAGTDEETVENETNEEESKILYINENSPSLLKRLERRDNEFNLPERVEYSTRSLLHKKDTNKQVSERGFLDERIVDLTHVSDYNKKEEFSADSLENAQLVQTVTGVVLPHNAQKLSTSYIVRKAENTKDYPILTDEVSDIFMENDAKLTAPTPSYSMSLAEKQDNTMSYGKMQGSTLSYDDIKDISVFSSKTQSNATSRDETQVNMMLLGEIQGTTVSHAETQDNTVSYGETQRNTVDFNEARSNTIYYTETQGSMAYSETMSNTVSQNETQSNTIYSEALGNTVSQRETQDNISSGGTTESNPVSDSTTQNSILPDEVTKRETNPAKVRRRESRFLVARHVRGMESLFNIMTQKELAESKSSSAANAQPAINTDSSLFSNVSPVTSKQAALEIEFSASPSPSSVHYNINDLSPAKSLVLTGRNEQSLKYVKHGNEDGEETKISEPKTNIEVAGVFIENITSSISLNINNDSESTPSFAEWSESLSTRGSSHSSPESTHLFPSYGANGTSSLTFNCKM
jgi:hypothetical protein